MLLYNATILPIKASLYIKSKEIIDINQTDLKTYKHLVEKLIYLICNIRLDISFVME